MRDSAELPEAERTRGAALADRLSMATLARAWQMLLKGIGEVEAAPDRRAAAEMVLIRLCHVADLPPPADLVRRLTEAAGRAGARRLRRTAARPCRRRRCAGGGQRRPHGRRAAPPMPRRVWPASATSPPWWPSGATRSLHAHLVHSVHLVRFAPPVIELRPEPDAPRDLAARLAAAAERGHRRRAGPSRCRPPPGEPTLAEQGSAADTARRAAAAGHPLVRAILDAFPGARIEAVHDARADAYGLTADAGARRRGRARTAPNFAPADAGFADGPPDDWES